MLNISPTWVMIGLDVVFVAYSLWVLSINKPPGKKSFVIGGLMFSWLAVLHAGLYNQAIFPQNISGLIFLIIIFSAVGLVGAALLFIPAAKQMLLALDQQQLMLLQGIRVFFGAVFLMQASLGVLPQTFGILDGFTHISAGFFSLVAAFSIATGIQGARRAWFANIFGLLDILVVASTLALVLLPDIGPHHSMMYAVFFPAPLWFWFHVISIWKLLHERKSVANSAHIYS